MTKEVHFELAKRVSWENVKLVEGFLRDYDSIDVTYNDGELFKMSIYGKDCVKITKLLLQYYEQKQLPKFEVGSPEYNLLKYHLKTSLEEAIEGEQLTTEMQSVISKYVDLSDGDSDVAVVTDLCGEAATSDDDISVAYQRSVIAQHEGCDIRRLDTICDNDLAPLIEDFVKGEGALSSKFFTWHDNVLQWENETYLQHEATASFAGLHNDHPLEIPA